MKMKKIEYYYYPHPFRDFPGLWLRLGDAANSGMKEKRIAEQVAHFVNIIKKKVGYDPIQKLAVGFGIAESALRDVIAGRDRPWYQIWNLLKITAIDPEAMLQAWDPCYDFSHLLKSVTVKNANISDSMTERLESGETDRRAQEIIYSKSDHTFVSSLRGAGFVDKLFRDGRRETGRLIAGDFVLVDDLKNENPKT
jgi:hypothetical protein